MAGTHQVLGHRHVGDQTLDRQPPPARLAKIVLVLVEAAEAQGDGHPFASHRALHARLLERVGVYVQVGRGVVLVVLRLMNLGGLDELELGPGRARSAGAASGVPALRAHASAADYVAQGDSLRLGGAVVLLVQAQALLRKPHLVVRVPPRRHVEDLLEDGARVPRNVVVHRSPVMLALDHLTGLEGPGGTRKETEESSLRSIYAPVSFSLSLSLSLVLSVRRYFGRTRDFGALIILSSRQSPRVCSVLDQAGNSEENEVHDNPSRQTTARVIHAYVPS